MQVAQTIYSQLGGNKFAVITGAKHFIGSKEKDNFLAFDFKMCRKANKCKITLNAMDLYDIEFFKMKPSKMECPKVKEFNGVYSDQLTDIFKSFTGLDTGGVR